MSGFIVQRVIINNGNIVERRYRIINTHGPGIIPTFLTHFPRVYIGRFFYFFFLFFTHLVESHYCCYTRFSMSTVRRVLFLFTTIKLPDSSLLFFFASPNWPAEYVHSETDHVLLDVIIITLRVIYLWFITFRLISRTASRARCPKYKSLSNYHIKINGLFVLNYVDN